MPDIVAMSPLDVVVVEPTLAGCAAAWRLARGGYRAALASTGTSPGYEYAACLQPWVEEAGLNELPEPFQGLYRDAMRHHGPAGFSEFHLGQWTQAMEDLLLDAGVELFYHTSVAAGLTDHRGQCAGVLLGGKFGLSALLAPLVIDATIDSIVARCLNVELVPRRNDGRVAVRQSMLIQQRASKEDSHAQATPTSDEVTRIDTAGGELVQHGRFLELRTELDHDPLHPLAHSALARSIRDTALTALSDDAWQEQAIDLLFNAEQPQVAPMLRLS